MIGDGVNDTPALSEADAGIAINTGAAIAREIADITISSQDLFELVTLRRLSEALMGRIDRNYRFIVSFNLMLIILGVTGVIQPTLSALLHNMHQPAQHDEPAARKNGAEQRIKNGPVRNRTLLRTGLYLWVDGSAENRYNRGKRHNREYQQWKA